MEMLQLEVVVEIIRAREHYEGRVNGQFVVSGDSYTEVYNDLKEMGYLR